MSTPTYKLKCYKFEIPFGDKNRGSVFTANFEKLREVRWRQKRVGASSRNGIWP